jgi:Ras GTPase-activating-like protein IQGAP2/3
MALDEVNLITLSISLSRLFTILQQNEVQQHLEEVDPNEGVFPPERRLTVSLQAECPESHLTFTQQYSNLFFLLQSEPRHVASLCRLVSLVEIDTLLQTVMFTLYGNQYESREEHLLLTMFQVCGYSSF